MPCGEGRNRNDDTAAGVYMSTPAKKHGKAGAFRYCRSRMA
jgi:hypothetical protein